MFYKTLSLSLSLSLDVDCWWTPFKKFARLRNGAAVLPAGKDDPVWSHLLSDFLFSPTGFRYQKDLVFNGTLECGEAAPDLLVKQTF